MLKTYFKIAWRAICKNKLHLFVNIAGLATGMSVAILIGLWIFDELSFDKYYKNHARIAQVMQNQTNNGEVQTMPNEPFPLGEEFKKSYGSDFKYVSMSAGGNSMLASGEKKLTRNGAFFQPEAIEMLDLRMIRGNRSGLNDPSSIMLSESVAKSLFGDANPMNQVMKIDDKMNVKVTGVYEDQPSNSTFSNVTFIAPWALFVNTNAQFFNGLKNNWGRSAFLTYVQIADNADMAKVSEKIRKLKINKAPEEATHKPELFLHPMSKWHLYADFKNGVNIGGRIEFVWIFGIIGVFVLLLACINFMNLSTAQSEKRSMEVGIRKTFGSLRSQLILQFLSESLIIVAFAFILSLVVVLLALPFFNELADKKMAVLWSNPVFWIAILSFSAITGLISGSYPALYLSSFKPVKVLNRTFKINSLAAIPRKILVVVQFTVSIVLIIGTIIVFRQIQFAKNRPMGYNVNGLVAMRITTDDIHKEFNVVQDELKNNGAIVSMAESAAPTTAVWGGAGGLDWRGKDPNLGVVFPISDMSVDFGKTIGWQFIAGRDFTKGVASDSSGFVINETAAKYMGFKNPTGETITWNGAPFQVVGVIKDMVVESPYEPVQPSIFHLSSGPGNIILVKLNPEISAAEALRKIESAFKKYNPSQPFDYQFVDEEYGRKFIKEERIGKLAGSFAVIAIFISCLGLFAMASFMTENRIKEIGIRKILGASIFNLWSLLSKDFIALVLCSILIAFPISFMVMRNWIQKYQYRSEISWWTFVAAGMSAILITLLTVSYKCIKAATMNPMKSLRDN
jgi:putative ABC transport system permease protein